MVTRSDESSDGIEIRFC